MRRVLATTLAVLGIWGAGALPDAASTTATQTSSSTSTASSTSTSTSSTRSATMARARSAYVRAVLSDRPSALLQGRKDLVGGAHGVIVGTPTGIRLPNGDPALHFDGVREHIRFAARRAFDVTATGVMTIEFWMRPSTLQFPRSEGSGYVYVLGKGGPGKHEWFARMYNRSNAESRPNRISGYSFNPRGGLGAGSYFQDRVQARSWIHVALVINTRARSSRYPLGYTRIYKNGVLRDTDSLADYGIRPKRGSAPLRIGTGYLDSFFHGAIGNVAFYPRELTPARLRAHRAAGIR